MSEWVRDKDGWIVSSPEEPADLEWFTGSNLFLDRATDIEKWRKRDPLFQQSMEAAADLRQYNREAGTNGNLGEWKSVATIRGPVLSVAEIAQPRLLHDKKKFYSWLDEHPQFLAYDRRKHGARRGDMAVFQNGTVLV